MLSRKVIESYQQKHPLLKKILKLEPVTWLNPNLTSIHHASFPLSKADVEEAELLWQRFVPFFKKEFPETEGIIESPLYEINHMHDWLKKNYDQPIEGKLFLKADNELAIAGSVKARGGFFEVLHYAETIAKQVGFINEESNYEIFSTDKFKKLFQQYTIGVGSTGNLGLSIGIMSAKLGFRVNVYMSKDAKQWKKDLLRDKGAIVYEFDGDFSEAITEGRNRTNADPKGYFVDDEKSKFLFLGYSTVAFRLKKQLDDKGIVVDEEHPLFLYLPCGVGGAPGGITFGMKQVFGDHVHCFFVEPTHSPAVLIGLLTGEKNRVCVQDFGIDNVTEADGLAVGRPSTFASIFSEKLVSGIYTLGDPLLYQLLTTLYDEERRFVEPSATAGIIGPIKVLETDYVERNNIDPQKITHMVWSTGGGLVPEKERKEFYEQGKES